MERVESLVRHVTMLLVEGRYKQVSELTLGVRLSEEDIRRAISRYGRTLVSPPEEALSLMDIVEIKTPRVAGVRQWAVAMPLWTKEEGRSDLTVELTILESAPVAIEIDDIHVL